MANLRASLLHAKCCPSGERKNFLSLRKSFVVFVVIITWFWSLDPTCREEFAFSSHQAKTLRRSRLPPPFSFRLTPEQKLRCPLRYSKMNMADRKEPSGRFSRHCQCPPVCIDYWPSYSLWHALPTWTSDPLSKVESSWTCLKNKVECQTGNLISLIK